MSPVSTCGESLRNIIDCSKPEGGSINNYVNEVSAPFSYQGVDDLVGEMARNDYIAMIDIKDAYRAINIHPSDRPCQAIIWDFGSGEEVSFENRLCMGLSFSPFIFNDISDFIVRCGMREGVASCINYLDDFAVLRGTTNECSINQGIIMVILHRMDFYLSYPKLLASYMIFGD